MTTAAELASYASSFPSFRNRIINGDMRIDQRNGGAAVTTSGAFPVDRFAITNSTDGAFSAQQDSSAPAGFVNSLKFTTTTADATIGASQAFVVRQFIEGYNVADLNFGSANAKTVTLSFWVRSSLTGTFSGSLATGAYDRSYPFTYSISVADTWEQKSITIAGDTSGTWLTTNGNGMRVYWNLGTGTDNTGTADVWVGAGNVGADSTVSIISTLNATWYITGVQLEVGTVATPFEHRPYGTELALCQRYCAALTAGGNYAGFGNGMATSTTNFRALIPLPVQMRGNGNPLTTSGSFIWAFGNSVSAFSLATTSNHHIMVDCTTTGLIYQNFYTLTDGGTGNAKIIIASEL
jgi:hypothetical protein